MRQTPRRRSGRGRFILEAVNLRVIAAAVVIASSLLLATILLLLLTRPSRSERGVATAVMTVIAANTPTATPPVESVPGVGAETPLPTPQPGVISLGAYVQIIGTDGAGLRLREQPGLSSAVLTLGGEAEVFRVEDGPQELDGYTWWYLVGPFDSSRRGWGVVNYLQVVQGP